jgi:hypothetical protein
MLFLVLPSSQCRKHRIGKKAPDLQMSRKISVSYFSALAVLWQNAPATAICEEGSIFANRTVKTVFPLVILAAWHAQEDATVHQ